MQVAALPDNEQARVNALLQYKILDTEAEEEFDDFVSLASFICHAPIAFVSLVDQTRQWFKAKIGCPVSETPRDVAFCAHVILQNDVFVVSDTLLDPRFADNPLVTGDPHIRFYAGAPLVTPEGWAIGTLCVIDSVPRELSSEQVKALKSLARQVVSSLELRRRTIDLQQLLESQNKLFHILSHDLRSPFNGILGFSQLLAEGAQVLSQEKIQMYAENILNSSEQFMQLINNLLSRAQFELGTLEFQPSDLSLDHVLNSVLKLLEHNASQKHIALRYQPHATSTVRGDSTMLHSVYQNVLSNAIKFTPENGWIQVETFEQDTMLRVSVTDSGIGMSSDKVASLFTTFENRSTQGTAGEKGTGLGLLLAKDLVEKHGGHLWAESEEGQGTTIHVSLPIALAHASVVES